MTEAVVRVVTGSRLHFGMLSVHPAQGRRFGGVGAMIARPGIELEIRRSSGFKATGPLAERAVEAARRAAAALNLKAEQGCSIAVLRAPPHHVGLGTGTQLAMAIAAGLNALDGRPPLGPTDLAACVGRGERSAVGLYGFIFGGLIYETGKADDDPVSPIGRRLVLPAEWRFVLARPLGKIGISGDAERDAFARLPPLPDDEIAAIRREALDRLLPAAAAARFDEFSHSLYRFNHASGLSFAAQQGGPFNGPRLTQLVETIRRRGVEGVGQSSWGPTIFALLPNQAAAAQLVEALRAEAGMEDVEFQIAEPESQGAAIEFRG